MFIVYQKQHERAKKEYPNGPAGIRWQKTEEGESVYYLHIGSESDLIVAKSSYKEDLMAFARRHGWGIREH